jgi:protoporphyrinogen oxidase
MRSNRKKIIIIGAGISGLSAAQLLQSDFDVTLLEQDTRPGGLIKCDTVAGNLFHRVGGHVFNSKNQAVLDWFWQFFDRDTEFRKAHREARIYLKGAYIGYPIENHLYQLSPDLVQAVITDLLQLSQQQTTVLPPNNFEAFLRQRFGNTLYNLYFGVYNQKIWNRDLSGIPLEWLADKLPMPRITEILQSNISRQGEQQMVHASFYYPVRGGSQFIINRLAEGLNIETGVRVQQISLAGNKISINNGSYTADHLIYCGDIRKLGSLLQEDDPVLQEQLAGVQDLPTNGTTNALCYTDDTAISWLYLPEQQFKAHRIIYTGNFSPENNAPGERKTCVVEFSGWQPEAVVREELSRLPGNLTFISGNHEPDSYIIHRQDTAQRMQMIRQALAARQIHLLGRFAEWQYYNMDKCIESAMLLKHHLLNDTVNP